MAEETKWCYLKKHQMFFNLTEQQLYDISNYAKVKTYSRGDLLLYGDENTTRIYLLVSGKVKLVNSDEADCELIKDIIGEGDFFGDTTLEGIDCQEYAEVLTTHAVVLIFDVLSFQKIIKENPQLAFVYAKKVSGKLKRLEDRHADLVFRSAKSRLIRFIKAWAQSDGNYEGDKIIINNYLTHADIANIIATSRQSVNHFFNELKDSGALSYSRKRIELRSSNLWN